MPILVGCIEDLLDEVQPHVVYRGVTALELDALANTFDPYGEAPKPFAAINPTLKGQLSGLPPHAHLLFEALPPGWQTWSREHGIEPKLVGGMTPAWVQGKLGVTPAQWTLLQDYLYGDEEPTYVAKQPLFWLLKEIEQRGGLTHLSAAMLGLPEGVSAEAFLVSFGAVESLRILTRVADKDLFRVFDYYGKYVARRPGAENLARFARLFELYYVEALENGRLSERAAWMIFLHEMVVCASKPKPKPSTSTTRRSRR